MMFDSLNRLGQFCWGGFLCSVAALMAFATVRMPFASKDYEWYQVVLLMGFLTMMATMIFSWGATHVLSAADRTVPEWLTGLAVSIFSSLVTLILLFVPVLVLVAGKSEFKWPILVLPCIGIASAFLTWRLWCGSVIEPFRAGRTSH
ncbi:MAG: hypothetical protein AAFV88_22155 [Planctomycetota bacterium]